MDRAIEIMFRSDIDQEGDYGDMINDHIHNLMEAFGNTIDDYELDWRDPRTLEIRAKGGPDPRLTKFLQLTLGHADVCCLIKDVDEY